MDDPDAPADPTARIVDPPSPPPPTSSWQAPVAPPKRADESRWPSLITGFILLGIGLWFFAEHTLGIQMPVLRWSQLWPLILIAVGALILMGALRRDRR